MTGESDERELLDIAREAARAAAAELLPRFGQRAEGVRSKSGPTDLVSEADVRAEAAIRTVLAERRPDDVVVGEEGGSGEGAAEGLVQRRLRWIVDPLDGTINFLFGVPLFAVSVACEDDVGGLAGVVLDPVREESFEATRSGDSTLNGSPISGSERNELGTALIATGFAYDPERRARQAEVVARVLPRVRDIRRCGAAALDLSWSACARFDGYYERGLHAWDLAAGGLIAQRAGLVLRELPEREPDPSGVVVAPSPVVDELYGLVAGE